MPPPVLLQHRLECGLGLSVEELGLLVPKPWTPTHSSPHWTYTRRLTAAHKWAHNLPERGHLTSTCQTQHICLLQATATALTSSSNARAAAFGAAVSTAAGVPSSLWSQASAQALASVSRAPLSPYVTQEHIAWSAPEQGPHLSIRLALGGPCPLLGDCRAQPVGGDTTAVYHHPGCSSGGLGRPWLVP